MTELRVGDMVKVGTTRGKALGGFRSGGIYEVEGVNDVSVKLDTTLVNEAGTRGYSDSDNLTLVSRTNLRKGDKVRYLGDIHNEDFREWAEVGETLIIEDADVGVPQSVLATREDGVELYFRPSELEYIVKGEEELKRDICMSSYKDAINLVHERVTKLEVEIAKLKAEKESEDKTVVKTNEARAEAIEVAKRFIRLVEEGASPDSPNVIGNSLFRTLDTEVKYTTCPRTGTVMAEAIGEASGRNRGTSMYVFKEGETFNEHIGKALALSELYGLDAPKEVVNYVEPDEAVVGTVVEPAVGSGFTSKPYEVAFIRGENLYEFEHGFITQESAIILDDSKALY